MSIKKINFEFDEGEILRFKTDSEKTPLVVSGYLVHGTEVMYELSCAGSAKAFHYSCEVERLNE